MTQKQRTASVARQTVLVILLLAVGAAFAYDKLVATPQWKAAWDKIKDVDAGGKAGSTTNEDIQELMGRAPATTDASRSDVFIEKFSWRGGLLFNTHDIYVVYAKPKVKQAEDAKKFYYSASAGQPPSDANFPLKTAVHMNLNPSPLMAGGGPPRESAAPPRGLPADADDQQDDAGDDDDDKDDDNTDDKKQDDPQKSEEAKSGKDKKGEGDKGDG